GSTTASLLRASILRMRFSRVSTISTASPSASAPPERPVPAPRGTNGMPCAPSSRTTAITSSRLPGSTTTPGTRRCVGSPSFAYVSDALPRHTHQRPDLLEGHGLAALFETVIEIENLALAGRQVLLEDAVDELAHQLAVGLLLDLAAFLAGEALAQSGRVLVAPVHRSVE